MIVKSNDNHSFFYAFSAVLAVLGIKDKPIDMNVAYQIIKIQEDLSDKLLNIHEMK